LSCHGGDHRQSTAPSSRSSREGVDTWTPPRQPVDVVERLDALRGCRNLER
jgi:hypothetical protein